MRWSCLIFLALGTIVRGQEICLSAEEDPYLLFATKTAYIFASRGLSNNRAHEVPGCEPKAFWLLNRHGSHNPEANEIEELQKLTDLRNNILSNYKNGNFRNTNQRICVADLNLLQQWEWNDSHNITFAGDVTSDGYITAQQLAQAWKQKFPGLLSGNRQDFLFKFVNDARSSNTFRAFTEGLFGAQAEGYDIPKENDEKLLRPYNFCQAWTNEVGTNNDTMEQLRIFESKHEYKEMISNISLRLGFNYDIQKESVLRMYQLCRYNKAWDVTKISPWCAVFSREDLKRLEYAEDLETYYKYGYGSEMNKNIGCTLVKDIINFFNNHISGDVSLHPKAMIHFTEAPMILMALVGLGARRDSAPLTGDNYHTNYAQARKWATSTVVPFNANIAAVLYQCTQNGNFQVNEPYQVLFLENEKPMNLEGCRVGLCDWTLVKRRYAELIGKCDLEFCNGATKMNGFTAISFTVVAFIINKVML